MKIYTKTGDDGTTQLFGGNRIPKNHPLTQAYGTVDELNSWLGLIICHLKKEPQLTDLSKLAVEIQNELFIIGSHIATQKSEFRDKLPQLSEKLTHKLELAIDQMTLLLPELKTFILPGGSEIAAQLHIARTVCRRAERNLVEASLFEFPIALVFLNRLSDYLFVLSRHTNHVLNKTETPWDPNHAN